MKKQGLTWKSKTFLFQNSSWKLEKSEKAKAGFDICQVDRGENKLDSMPRALERAKAKFGCLPNISVEKETLTITTRLKSEEQENRKNGARLSLLYEVQKYNALRRM